jgi:DNA-binding NtrC family response regulator
MTSEEVPLFPILDLDLGDAHRVRLAEPAMLAAFARLRRAAASPLPVLVTGETGVGKDLAARAVHLHSGRSGPMVCINCGGLPDGIVESELFGHEHGSFTGAVAARPGHFEQAAGGTLFLDEVGELPLRAQGALLRALDGRPISRVGGRTPYTPDVRVVAATNRDLETEIARGNFRADLFYRLGGARVHLPPLRDRPRELPLLADDLLAAACAAIGRAPARIAASTMEALAGHSWPGNVRELKHAMQHAASMCEGRTIAPSHLPDGVVQASEGRQRPRGSLLIPPWPGAARPGQTLADELTALEQYRILEALVQTDGNQAHAARRLGMPRRTFLRKLKQHAITPDGRSDTAQVRQRARARRRHDGASRSSDTSKPVIPQGHGISE